MPAPHEVSPVREAITERSAPVGNPQKRDFEPHGEVLMKPGTAAWLLCSALAALGLSPGRRSRRDSGESIPFDRPEAWA